MRGVVAAFLILAFVLQGTIDVLAGTTGTITGTVVDASTNRPIAGAKVSALSPSQSASTTSDSNGRFTFVSLSPDTYSLTVAASSNHDPYSLNGVTVQADASQTVTLAQPTTLQKIGSVTSRAASALVKPGTTADIYSISATIQDKASQLGGGGTINSAWSAISSVPGVYVAPNQNGYIGAGATLSIRGGDYDQIGYELDGIPVNRAFDQYPSSSLSSLGQQELQVYTGSTPANAEANGISGYINQVIKTGTAPAYRSLDAAVGTPTLYNRLAFETGGANPARTFSYYVGLGAYNQNFRYADQFNGASLQRYNGAPLGVCPTYDPVGNPAFNPSSVPSCFAPNGTPYTNNSATPAYVLGPYGADSFQTSTQARDSVVNLHFGIPHKDGNKDDVQLLYDNNHLGNIAYSSTNDLGGAAFLNAAGIGPATWPDGYQIAKPYGTLLPAGYTSGGNVASTYLFPNSPTGRAFGSEIPYNQRSSGPNDQSILKLQYQHNFGTNAFLRVYGYTYYSDWLMIDPASFNANYLGFFSPDYELSSHTRGLSATFSDQITAQHLLTVQGSYTTSSSLRYNNSGIGFGSSTTIGYLVNGNNPYSGTCYSVTGAADVGCNYGSLPFAKLTMGQALNGYYIDKNGNKVLTPVPAAGVTCGGGPCQYALVAGGPSATYNTVKPKFSSGSITDNWHPTDKLNINIGLRYDQFQFIGADTTNSGARTLFYNAYNATLPPGATPLVNTSGGIDTYNEWQPRAGFTYTVNPSTVIRGSYGRYAEAPNAAFEQYNYLQPNDLSKLIQFGSLGLGYTPMHNVKPEVSNNYDVSLEHQFKGDVATKLTPFYRKTQDQIQQFYLDQKTNFVSGLNVGRQTSEGVELELDKGDFSRNGLAGRLSMTYTNSYINYTKAPNGSSVVDGINQIINGYNNYTKAGGGSPCYTLATSTTSGVPTACGPGTIANPYYNAPKQALLDPNGSYPTFDTFPAGVGSSYATYGAPYMATAIVQYKHDKLAVTPALQFSGGQRYGAPANLPGISPDSCTGTTGTPAVGDARYNVGSVGGQGYDATTCAAGVAIPNPYTGRFDGLGQYVAPSILQLHLQVSYDVSKRVTIVTNFSNLYNRCFGGSKGYWTYNGACNYTTLYGQSGGITPSGNVYNPGDNIQPFLTVPYGPTFNGFPFNMFVEARIKI
jgi:outer membrane receptor protein involved in Fe transport